MWLQRRQRSKICSSLLASTRPRPRSPVSRSSPRWFPQGYPADQTETAPTRVSTTAALDTATKARSVASSIPGCHSARPHRRPARSRGKQCCCSPTSRAEGARPLEPHITSERSTARGRCASLFPQSKPGSPDRGSQYSRRSATTATTSTRPRTTTAATWCAALWPSASTRFPTSRGLRLPATAVGTTSRARACSSTATASPRRRRGRRARPPVANPGPPGPRPSMRPSRRRDVRVHACPRIARAAAKTLALFLMLLVMSVPRA